MALRSLAVTLPGLAYLNKGSFFAQARGYASSATSNVINVTSDAQFSSIIKDLNGGLCIVDFTAKWCGPCRQIAPIYDKLSLDHAQVKFLKVDIDDPNVSQTVVDHSIAAVPTFIAYHGSKKVETFTGANPARLKDIIARHGVAAVGK